ncbi:MAG: protein kinase [Myxococcota bacterium]
MACPEPEALNAFSRGGLNPAERRAIESHLDDCDGCSRVVAELARIFATQHPGGSTDVSLDELGVSESDTLADESLPMRAKVRLHPGERVDRYYILELIGSGGMGVVYAAYDPDLDRKVALKALHDRHSSKEDDEERAQRRLLREAQAMARLSHPNVITVHQVREIEGRVFISMEFVEGGTLTQWLARAKPDQAKILEMFQAIGRGLGAAHEAGLIHSDIKPDNVLIGADERPRVTDFGLARPSGQDTGRSSRPADSPFVIESGLLDATVSRTKGLRGTPAYMAPEQILCEQTSAASDQFSFCVALFEALWGVRPFGGTTFAELSTNILDGNFTEVTSDASVPRWLRNVVMRGLSFEPKDRWPSMAALVEGLAYGPRRKRRGLIALGVVGAASIVAGSVASSVLSAPSDPCEGGEIAMEELWSTEARAEVHHALSRGQTQYAEDTATLAVRRIDEYAQQWSRSHRDACVAYHRGDQSGHALDLRGACLDERRQELDALIGVLVLAEPEVRRHAVQAIDELRPLAPCEDLKALRAQVPPPSDPAVRARVQRVESDLARAQAHGRSGRYDAGLALVKEATHAAIATDYAPLIARALQDRAGLHMRMGEYEAAVVDLEEAWRRALGAGDDALAASSVVQLVDLLGYVLRRYDEAQTRAEDARAMIERIWRQDPARAEALDGELDYARGQIELRHHNYDRALALYGRALTLAERHAGPEGLRVARVLNSMASARLAKFDWDAALETYQRALEIRTRHLGEAHPQTAQARNNVGLALKNMKRYDEAAAQFELSHRHLTEALDADHPALGMVSMNLAEVYYHLRRYEDAMAYYDRAFDEFAIEDIGDSYTLRKALHFGTSLLRVGRDAEAREVLGWVVQKGAELEAPGSSIAAEIELARLELQEGKAEDALARLQPIADEKLGVPVQRADRDFLLARALAEVGKRDAALALVPEIEPFVGEKGAPSVTEFRQWVTALGDRPAP